MDDICTASDSASIPGSVAMESVGSSSKPINDGGMAIRMNELPRALAEDQNKLIHLDPIPDFKDKAEIKPWLQKILYPQGIEIVIERSDNIKVIFKCKAAKRGKNAKLRETTMTGSSCNTTNKEVAGTCMSNENNNNNGKKKRSVSRFNTCPFRIRATFSLKRKKWSIVIVNNSHSHDLRFNPDSDEYRKFKAKLREDNDWYAVKQFDALEYRTMSNFPIESSVIPCACGLTSEIESFSIVLPSAEPVRCDDVDVNAMTDINHRHINSNGIGPIVSKPRSKKWQQQQQQKNRDKLVQNPSRDYIFTQSQFQEDCPTEFFDVSSFTDSLAFSRQEQLTEPVNEFNEIDFTDFFKPHSINLRDTYSNGQENQPVDILESTSSNVPHQSSDELQPLLLTQMDAGTNEMMTSTDDILALPSQTTDNPQEMRSLSTLCPQEQESISETPLHALVNGVDSQAPYPDHEYPVDDLLWKMNFQNS